jgi:hypothetical protein
MLLSIILRLSVSLLLFSSSMVLSLISSSIQMLSNDLTLSIVFMLMLSCNMLLFCGLMFASCLMLCRNLMLYLMKSQIFSKQF